MNLDLAARAIEGLRADRARVLSEFERDYSDADEDARAQWEADFVVGYVPFQNELCLALLLAIHHEVERDLVKMAARVTRDGRELSWEENRARVAHWEAEVRKPGREGWTRLYDKLHVDQGTSDATALELLRHVANSYKHDPWGGPSHRLRRHLKLEMARRPGDPPDPLPPELFPFGALSESGAVTQAILAALQLPTSGTYCDIAQEFLRHADNFLANVTSRNPGLSRVGRHPKGMLYDVICPR